MDLSQILPSWMSQPDRGEDGSAAEVLIPAGSELFAGDTQDVLAMLEILEGIREGFLEEEKVGGLPR